jgi:hypothetical protein
MSSARVHSSGVHLMIMRSCQSFKATPSIVHHVGSRGLRVPKSRSSRSSTRNAETSAGVRYLPTVPSSPLTAPPRSYAPE